MIEANDPLVLKSVVKESVAVAVASLPDKVMMGGEVYPEPGLVITNPVTIPSVTIAFAVAGDSGQVSPALPLKR